MQKEWLSHYCLKIANEHNITIGSVKKLVPNLMNKNNYVIHYRIFQQCLALGIRLEKIHRLLQFKQNNWIRAILILTQKKVKNQITNLIRIFLN